MLPFLYLAAIFGAKEGFRACIRNAAVKALGEIGKRNGGVRMFVTLQLAGNEGHDKDVRAIIVETLGEIGDPRDVEVITGFLKDEDWYVHRKTVDAIQKIERGEALIKALGNKREGAESLEK